ncbi:MAG: hypothetical protein M1834_008574 [Cirrosporium novae-zelandiae]|nr:MAG: hypothetical protein M1834_008574 [Cirrosporium novae-zelandiae]
MGLKDSFRELRNKDISIHQFIASLEIRALTDNYNALLQARCQTIGEWLSRKDDPTFEEYRNTLQTLLGAFTDVHIVVDALDECKTACQSEILIAHDSLFRGAEGRTESCKVHVLLSSRANDKIQDFYDLHMKLLPTSKIDVRATADDIKTYVVSTLEEHEKHMKQDGKPTPLRDNKPLRDDVLTKLVEKSEGMFLWTKLQVSHLKTLEKSLDIEQFIRSLPISEEIEDTYIQILTRIQALDGKEREIAESCLLWTTYAAEPLRCEELANAIHIDDTKPPKFTSSIDDTNIILRVCANFLEKNESTGDIVFIHFSAAEFFRHGPTKAVDLVALRSYFPTRSAAELKLAKLCSKCLNHSFGEKKATSVISSISWFLLEHPLAFYACNCFDRHLFQTDDIDDEAISQVERFLNSENAILVGFMLIRTLDNAWDAYEFDTKVKFWPGQISRETIIRATLLNRIGHFQLFVEDIQKEIESNRWIFHHAAFSGDINLVEEILRNAPSSKFIQQTHARGATALYYAARQGYKRICQRLMDVGEIPLDAEVNIRTHFKGADACRMGGFYNTPLQAASWGGHYGIVHELLGRGKQRVNVNARSSKTARTYCALQAAAFHRHDAIVYRLINAGAIIDISKPERHTTQFGADINAESGRNDVAVKFLIEKGADVAQVAGTYGTALQVALYRGWRDVVDTLLELNADIHEKVGTYGNSLQAAACSTNEQLVRLALDEGVVVNSKGGYFASALIAAAQHGSLPVVKMLVDAGAYLEAFDYNYGTALDVAAYHGYTTIVQYLLEKGAKVGNALAEIASTSHVHLAEVLIARGAGVNIRYRSPYEVALQAAAWGGQPGMVQLLLDRGANVHFKGGAYGNALHAAVYTGNLEVVKKLLAASADPNDPTGKEPNGTPLQCACPQIHEDIAHYLLENGAKVNMKPCGKYGTALQAAVVKNYEPVVNLLLDYGAEVNAVGGEFGTAIQAAMANENLRLVELLLEKGADPNLKGKHGRALQETAYGGNEAIVRLLSDHNSRANAVSERGLL